MWRLDECTPKDRCQSCEDFCYNWLNVNPVYVQGSDGLGFPSLLSCHQTQAFRCWRASTATRTWNPWSFTSLAPWKAQWYWTEHATHRHHFRTQLLHNHVELFHFHVRLQTIYRIYHFKKQTFFIFLSKLLSFESRERERERERERAMSIGLQERENAVSSENLRVLKET